MSKLQSNSGNVTLFFVGSWDSWKGSWGQNLLRGALPVNSFTLTVSIDRSLQPILVLYTGLFKPNYFSIQFFLDLLISSETVQNPISATIPAQKSPYFLLAGMPTIPSHGSCQALHGSRGAATTCGEVFGMPSFERSR